MTLPFPDPALPDDQVVVAFSAALNRYLVEQFTCQYSLAESTLLPERCIRVEDESLSLYLRFKSGLYDCTYDRPLAISRMRFVEKDQDHDIALLQFFAAHAVKHDIGTIILEHGSVGEDTFFFALSLLFKPCGFHPGNWHIAAQDLLGVLERVAAA